MSGDEVTNNFDAYNIAALCVLINGYLTTAVDRRSALHVCTGGRCMMPMRVDCR